MSTKTTYFPMAGGLDVSTPAFSVPPGRGLVLINFEPWYNGGYRRIKGYERFDGRPRPHLQTFIGFDVSTVAGLTLQDTITDDVSGATGTLVGIWDDDGTYGSDAIAVAHVTGSFGNGNACNTGSFTIDSDPTQEYAPSISLEATWMLEAQDLYREDIQVVPGSGAVRGAWMRGSTAFAVRDNAGATAGVLHISSTSGWTTSGVTMAEYIYFSGGGGGTGRALPEEGDTITGVSSGATATVHRVVSHGGATATNDEYGYLVLTNVSGGPFITTESLQESGTTAATADGINISFAFSVGGRYSFRNHNFFGGVSTYRTYGVNGVDPAFEIDENNIVSPILLPKDPITDQPATNDPFLLEIHRTYLFLAYQGGSLVQTVIGSPLTINGFLGAAEFGIGDEITGLNSVVGGVLVVTSERETRGIFGKDETDWEMKLIGEKVGGKLHTSMKLDTVYSLDDLGITSVARTDSFGSFIGATVSQLVQPIISVYRGRSTTASITRGSNQYRIYFSDGTGLIMYVPNSGSQVGGESKASVQFGQLTYPEVVQNIYNTEDADGAERTFFTSDDGYVREEQVGTSFDGENILSYARMVYNQIGSPSRRKKFRRAVLELQTSKVIDLKVISDLTYGSLDSKTNINESIIEVDATGGLWDLVNWDEFVWDGQTVSTATTQLGGTGTNIGLLLHNDSATAESFILQGITIHYDLRRLQR